MSGPTTDYHLEINSNSELVFAHESFAELFSRSATEVLARLGLVNYRIPINPDLAKIVSSALSGVPSSIDFNIFEKNQFHSFRAAAVPHSASTPGARIYFESLNPKTENVGLLEFEDDSQFAPLAFWRYSPATDEVKTSLQPDGNWGSLATRTMAESIAFCHPDDHAKCWAAINATTMYGDDYHIEFRVMTSETDFIYTETRGELEYNAKGEVEAVMGTVFNITNRKKLEIFLREKEHWFHELANHMPQQIWTKDPQGVVTYLNRQLLDYMGELAHEKDESLSARFVHPEDLQDYLLLMRKSLARGTDYETEIRLLNSKDQSYRWHLCRAVALKDENQNTLRWLGTNTDIHDKKILEVELFRAKVEAEKAALLKSYFLANMSHEIRTPLTAIIGFTNLLSDKSCAENDRKKYLDIINRSSQSLIRLINDILDISKFESGKFFIETISFSFSALLDEVVTSFSATSEMKGIYFELEIDPRVAGAIKSDPSRLRQILNNIIGNAVKFTDKGWIKIKARLEGCDVLLIEISDSGIGLADEQAERLFQPFSQADQSTTRRFGGSGLGLDLSRRLARALGGDVELSSYALGQGCVFLIKIHVEVEPSSEMVAVPSIVEPGRFVLEELPLSKKVHRVLLVDDAIENQFLVTEILKGRGYDVVVASNGAQALEIESRSLFDCIIMDMQMPVLDGYDATRILRKKGFKKPIIALTALALPEEREEILNCGCDEHLTKPIDFMALLNFMEKLGIED